MKTEEQITIGEVYKILRKVYPRYQKAERTEKSAILNELEVITGRHRKSLIRLLKNKPTRKKRKTPRSRTYKADFDRVLKLIYESYDRICAERLHPNLVQLAEQLASHQELELTEFLRKQLNKVSLSTVHARLKQYRQDEPRLRKSKSSKPNPYLQDIPMERIPWDVDRPGCFEVDLVHHCGPSSHGEFVHTLQMVDVYSGWSERTALLGRSYRMMQVGFERLLQRLPFPVLKIHPDNGSEFFNSHIQHFWQGRAEIKHGRSRPYVKNDNRYVEEKNRSLVRAYVGDIRLDTVPQTQALERIFQQLWLYNNCFQPSLKLIDKQVIPDESKPGTFIVKRRIHSALTPWQRLCDSGCLFPEQQTLIQAQIDATNPSVLRQHIYDDLDKLFSYPAKSSNHPEDVFVLLSS